MSLEQGLITEQNGRTRFPTLISCVVCHGYIGLYSRTHGQVMDKELAANIARIQHGYYLKMWEGKPIMNKKNYPFACICECNHDWSRKTISNCLHKLTCKNCGKKVEVDSSD